MVKQQMLTLACAALVGCASAELSPPTCSPLQCTYTGDEHSIRKTSLRYTINYDSTSYEVVAEYDVHFLDGSSTNGVPARFSGFYDQEVRSEVGHLKGSYTYAPTPGLAGGKLDSEKRFYLEGIIKRPDTPHLREYNRRALSLHVEERYTSVHSPTDIAPVSE